jgi:hypothetical protein
MLDTTARSVVPARYIQALGVADPIESQRKAPKRLKKLIKGLSEKQLSRRPAPDKWSIKEVIAHLADGEVIMGSRIRFVAAQDCPPLPSYDQDLFVQNLGVDQVKTKELLEAFAMARKLNMQLIARLPESALDRVGLHAERGEESIRTMLTMYAGHDVIHEEQIAAAREELRAKKTRGKNTSNERRSATDGAKNGEAEKAEKPEKAARKALKKISKKERKHKDRASMAEILPG